MAEYKHSSVPSGFKEIPGYDGLYFINEKGEVWSNHWNKLLCSRTDKGHPYPYLKLRKNGKSVTTEIHYLMRITWMGSPPGNVGIGRDLWCINHKDGNKLNNCIDNLEWVTCSENVKHAWHIGLHKIRRGEDAPSSRLSSQQVREIRLRCLSGEPVKKIAESLNEGVRLIKQIKVFESWRGQDHDLVEPMLKISSSRFLHNLKKTLDNNKHNTPEIFKTCR